MTKDYKDTLNLPMTDFPMKANLAQREPETLKFWDDLHITAKIQQRSRDPLYILHDGPPYANGHIHMGHALNKILKDIIVKYRVLQGCYAPYVPGWDCHGLPIELQVDKNLGDRKHSIDIIEKRRLCREYAEKFVDIQREEFRRLGVLGDWDNPYLTMSYEYEASIVREFNTFVKKGSVYKGKKPVHWCPSCVTALAEAEVEYADKESPSVYVAFPVAGEAVQEFFPSLAGKSVSVLIWTTTPWTLPANLALAFHPDFEYAAVEYGERVLIIAEGRLEALRERLNIRGNVIERMRGGQFDGLQADHPFLERKSRVVLGDFVSLDEGTGIVHIAPGHGEDDYDIGIRHGLDIYAPVDDQGKFTVQAGDLAGQFVFKANAGIVETLRERGALILEEKITHSYPHCWRCKKPVIFRATEQWFISVEKNGLRDACLNEVDRVAWVPRWGRDRIHGMLRNRPDWCISRQRSWGVPITLLTCEKCETFVDDEKVLDSVVDLIRENGADIWFQKNPEELLPAGYTCVNCGHGVFRKEMDILDVWFDSGVSHAAVMERDQRLSWPADLYLEGSDQHRGWFQSSLLASVGTRGAAPYRTVLTHGFVVDGAGKKMSKSQGNVIAPQEIIKGFGAEILRIWVSSEDYRDDIRISKEILNRLTEAYRKIRNTCRFLLGNLSDFDYADHSGQLREIDRWAMSRLQTLVLRVRNAYEHFDFHEVFHAIHNFCVVDMSSLYLDILKDRLYTAGTESPERRAGQWVLMKVLSTLTGLMAPVLSFSAEEVWQQIRKMTGDSRESVFLTSFPEPDAGYLDKELENSWEKLIEIRNVVNKALEGAREQKLIGNALEAKITVNIGEKDSWQLLKDREDFLSAFFIVSKVEIAYVEGPIPVGVTVEKASGQKCLRCWNWSEKVGSFSEAPELCERCRNVLR